VKPSVIRIRIEGLKAAACSALIQTILSQCEADLEQGCVVTVQDGRIRIRRLPLS
jgi:predicted nuclease of predicted toxin-antitoxin system